MKSQPSARKVGSQPDIRGLLNIKSAAAAISGVENCSWQESSCADTVGQAAPAATDTRARRLLRPKLRQGDSILIGIECLAAAVTMADPKKGFVERLFAQHHAGLQAFFRRRIRTKSDAADLVQEVYVRMLRVSDTEAIRNPELYLYTVAGNLAKE